jgi:hypothetical protein
MGDLAGILVLVVAVIAFIAFRRGLRHFHESTGIHPIFIWVVLMVIVFAILSNSP